jgi:hypothetical protein
MTPRFPVTTLLIVFTLVALWLSTLAGYSGGEDIRAFIMLGCLIASGVAALSCTAHRRAFWLGFFGTLLALAFKSVFGNLGAGYRWAPKVSFDLSRYLPFNPRAEQEVLVGVNMTIVFLLTLVAATLIGLVCVYVYDQAAKQKGE